MSMLDEQVSYVPLATLQRQSEALLGVWGLTRNHAAQTSCALVDADARGVASHGVSLLIEMARWRSEGGLPNIGAQWHIEADAPATALIDAKGALGFAVSCAAVDLALEKARATGLSFVTVRNSHTFGAAGYYARIIARQGYFALVTTSSKIACVVAPGSGTSLLGTNPLAWAMPVGPTQEPISFDMATSCVAGNAVRMAALNGHELSDDWVVDAAGNPVTDAQTASEIVFGGQIGGGLTALGGHKGFGLALLVHALAGLIPGAQNPATGLPASTDGANIGHAFLVIDPGAIRLTASIERDTQDFISSLRSACSNNGGFGIRLPGERGAANGAEAILKGVPLPSAVRRSISQIARESGVAAML